jgi:hypothetical protein
VPIYVILHILVNDTSLNQDITAKVWNLGHTGDNNSDTNTQIQPNI